jgi:poly(A) polymerase
MLRLLKFQARFGFEVDPTTQIALLECRAEIVKSAPARVLEELLRMLESGSSEQFFRLMTDHGLLHLMMPAFGEFMESSRGEDVLSYLKEIDTTFHETGRPKPDRTALLACLIFPILEKRIDTRFASREKIPHLGEIYSEVQDQIDEVFRPFLQLPRRLRIGLASILTSQYRLTPLDKKRKQRIRIPHDPDFGNALKFFEVRACLQPALQQTWQEWNEVCPPMDARPHEPRRRRRRRPSTEERHA